MQESINTKRAVGPAGENVSLADLAASSVEREYIWLRGVMEACPFGQWSNERIQAVSGATEERVLKALQAAEAFARKDLQETIHAKSLAAEELHALIAEVLERFPAELRLVVALIYREKFNFSEAAEVMQTETDRVQAEYCKSLVGLRIGLAMGTQP